MNVGTEDRNLSSADRKASAEAAVWMVRLYGEDRNPELEQGLREWLASHPRNARHFEDMTDVWDLGGEVTTDGMPRMRSWGKARAGFTWRWAMAAVVLVLGAVGLFSGYGHWLGPAYTTGHGEQRLVRLQDGSRITLNSSTRLKVELTDTVRRVRLEQGEALFEVAQDRARPFTVVAGAREVTALGTSFVVRYEADRTAVTLVEGKVRVSDESVRSQPVSQESERQPEKAVAVLTPGERVTFVKKQPPKVDSPRIETVTAWRRGEVLLDKTPLSDAVAEMNRYDDRQLVIDDDELAALRVSGVYKSGNSDGFARAVAELHGLAVSEEGARIHLKR